ncbi:FeoA family protein [Phenylobacterium sp.]|uniref:FeoA family protein n=1 Tax=Phenylobacterium sp. TaxID=1871053 RepID=UPI002736B228|nr:FeoA family protein [Phenylobacterium sp.]MDP3175785.1 FeoA family protein [Phenylobacterium sp.]MDP3658598.1 FeoA family protein [Phenylobacterium sp.]
MTETLAQPDDGAAVADGQVLRLSAARVGDRGVIVEVRAESHADGHGVDVHELERRLLEFGFVEGAQIEVMHQGAIGADPLAVRLDDMRVALRRRDAEDVYIRLDARRAR